MKLNKTNHIKRLEISKWQFRIQIAILNDTQNDIQNDIQNDT